MTLMLPLTAHAQSFDSRTFQASLDHGLRGSQGSAVVVDVATGKLLASYKLAAAPPQEPGSTLKPVVAAIALKSGAVTENTEVECHGTLTIGHHDLKCSHPRVITIFDLQHAIAYSCNSWFAQLAQHIPADQLINGLRSYGLAPAAAVTTVEQRQLLTLGLEGIRVTPLQLANAYRLLASQIQDKKLRAIKSGLVDSVSYGMAHNAATAGVLLGGKTGTAANSGAAGTHGMFVGIIYSPTTGEPQAVIDIWVTHGNGADAAALAQRCLLHWSQQ
jgi:cell division protein FtsI/penicillin-binding protein 2